MSYFQIGLDQFGKVILLGLYLNRLCSLIKIIHSMQSKKIVPTLLDYKELEFYVVQLLFFFFSIILYMSAIYCQKSLL